MVTPQEITDLFARLASQLQTLTPHVTDTCDLSISNLNRSLNLNEDHNSRVRVLDKALSLMCFKAPQVFDSLIEYNVNTIVSVLSSLVSCKVLRFDKDEVLEIGGLVSRFDFAELVGVFSDFVEKLEGFGVLSHLLSYAVVRVVAMASSYWYMFPLMPVCDVKLIGGRSDAISKMLCCLPKDISHKDHEIPMRLLLWYLDPLNLKGDISKILQEAMQRPFLCLNKEFHERMDWHSILVCLVFSPTMFVETRALLHNWFLLTGLASVLELLIELVSLILDVISRPTWWGISMEMGLKLPFSNAYFPHKHHLLRILAGPFSSECVIYLVHNAISKPVSYARKHLDPTIKQAAMKVARTDHKSSWAMAMNFPDWFLFASLLLFAETSFQQNFHSKCTLEAAKSEKACDAKPISSSVVAAARYIAWILSPINESHQDLLFDCLVKISASWTLKQFGADEQNKGTAGYGKKLKTHGMEDYTLQKVYDCQRMLLWLKEFQNIYVRCWNKIVKDHASCEGKPFHGVRHNALFRRIPLGILVGCSNDVSEDGCELLLHYAATGSILQSRETQSTGLEHLKRNSEGRENSIIWTEECNKKEAVAGACLVFNLTDVVERMSASMFQTEESGIDLICRVKVRAGKYLTWCIKNLVQLKIDDDGILMLKDLYGRLMQWRHQGQEVFQGYKDLADVIDALSHRLSSL